MTEPRRPGAGGSISIETSSAKRTRRLTLDVDEELHRQIRLHCAATGRRQAEVIRELLAERFLSW